jgi:hypothetical protein
MSRDMNEKDREWFNKCKQYPEKYQITVDNDCISANETNPFDPDTQEEQFNNFDGGHYSFSEFGEDFIVGLLRHIGIDADQC